MSALRPEVALVFALRRLAIDAEEACARVYDRSWPDEAEDFTDAWENAIADAEWGKTGARVAVVGLERAHEIAKSWGVEGAIQAADAALELLRAHQASSNPPATR